MTNGEKIQEIFKGCDVCEPIIEDNIIHVSFVDKNDSAIGFDWSWWNAEYKEPTIKNNLGVDCIDRNRAIERFKSNAEYERTHGNLQGCLEFRQLSEWLEKLQKIEQILKDIPYGGDTTVRRIQEVVENGNDD